MITDLDTHPHGYITAANLTPPSLVISSPSLNRAIMTIKPDGTLELDPKDASEAAMLFRREWDRHNSIIADAVRNFMGLFDNPVERRRRADDQLFLGALEVGRRAMALIEGRDGISD